MRESVTGYADGAMIVFLTHASRSGSMIVFLTHTSRSGSMIVVLTQATTIAHGVTEGKFRSQCYECSPQPVVDP